MTVSTRSLTDEALEELAQDESLTPEKRAYIREEQEFRRR